MIRESLRSSVDGQVEVTAPRTIDVPGDPPAKVIAGTHDPIIDSAQAFARRINDAGGSTVDYFPDVMPHGFSVFPGVHAEGNVAYHTMAGALAGVFRR